MNQVYVASLLAISLIANANAQPIPICSALEDPNNAAQPPAPQQSKGFIFRQDGNPDPTARQILHDGLSPIYTRVCQDSRSNGVRVYFRPVNEGEQFFTLKDQSCADIYTSYLAVQRGCNNPDFGCSFNPQAYLRYGRKCGTNITWNPPIYYWSRGWNADDNPMTNVAFKAPGFGYAERGLFTRTPIIASESPVAINLCLSYKKSGPATGIPIAYSDDVFGKQVTGSFVTTKQCTRVTGRFIWIDNGAQNFPVYPATDDRSHLLYNYSVMSASQSR